MMEYITLSNGFKIPKLGYGVYQITNDKAQECVENALLCGYRLIDTAQAYHNEQGVGKAISHCDIARKDLFITSKIWISNYQEHKAYASIEDSLRNLNLDYIDLMLIHQPFGDYYSAYRALEKAQADGLVRSIGVSNFYTDRLVDICLFAHTKPVINQVETHVFNQQKKSNQYMKKYGVQIESWGPFAEGRNNFFTNTTLMSIAKECNKSVAQIALRFLLQKDIITIPKTINKDRMLENINIFDFILNNEQISKIENLDLNQSQFFSHYDPNTVEFIANLR